MKYIPEIAGLKKDCMNFLIGYPIVGGCSSIILAFVSDHYELICM